MGGRHTRGELPEEAGRVLGGSQLRLGLTSFHPQFQPSMVQQGARCPSMSPGRRASGWTMLTVFMVT